MVADAQGGGATIGPRDADAGARVLVASVVSTLAFVTALDAVMRAITGVGLGYGSSVTEDGAQRSLVFLWGGWVVGFDETAGVALTYAAAVVAASGFAAAGMWLAPRAAWWTVLVTALIFTSGGVYRLVVGFGGGDNVERTIVQVVAVLNLVVALSVLALLMWPRVRRLGDPFGRGSAAARSV